MAFNTSFNLKANPFRSVPANQAEELVWAGFDEIKGKFEERIKKGIRIPNSGLVLNWGEYGSGKTHAAKFFGKQSVLEKLASESKGSKPLYIYLTLPKGRSPIEDIFTAIIDKLDIGKLRSEVREISKDIDEYIDNTFDDTFVKTSVKAVFSIAEQGIVKRFLYGSLTPKEIRDLGQLEILRGFKSENDYIKFLSGLFSTLTFNKRVYSCVILWIDEFEDIATLTRASSDKVNSFLREIFDNTPSNLLVFLNLTQSPLFTVEDLGEYMSESLKSRIRHRINFETPNQKQLTEYLEDLLSAFRIENQPDKSGLFPFDVEVVRSVFSDFKNASLRRYNDIFSTLLELADIESIPEIDIAFYEKNKNEITGF